MATAGLNQGQVTELLCEGRTGAGLCAAIQNEVRFSGQQLYSCGFEHAHSHTQGTRLTRDSLCVAMRLPVCDKS